MGAPLDNSDILQRMREAPNSGDFRRMKQMRKERLREKKKRTTLDVINAVWAATPDFGVVSHISNMLESERQSMYSDDDSTTPIDFLKADNNDFVPPSEQDHMHEPQHGDSNTSDTHERPIEDHGICIGPSTGRDKCPAEHYNASSINSSHLDSTGNDGTQAKSNTPDIEHPSKVSLEQSHGNTTTVTSEMDNGVCTIDRSGMLECPVEYSNSSHSTYVGAAAHAVAPEAEQSYPNMTLSSDTVTPPLDDGVCLIDLHGSKECPVENSNGTVVRAEADAVKTKTLQTVAQLSLQKLLQSYRQKRSGAEHGEKNKNRGSNGEHGDDNGGHTVD
eukprot:3695745-Rhodomonas_salina.1